MTTTTSVQTNGADSAPQPIRPGRGASILGPRNLPVEVQNPDLLVAPVTDAGTIPNLSSRTRLRTTGSCPEGGRERSPRGSFRSAPRSRA